MNHLKQLIILPISLFPLSIPSPKLRINKIRNPPSSPIPKRSKEIKNPKKYLKYSYWSTCNFFCLRSYWQKGNGGQKPRHNSRNPYNETFLEFLLFCMFGIPLIFYLKFFFNDYVHLPKFFFLFLRYLDFVFGDNFYFYTRNLWSNIDNNSDFKILNTHLKFLKRPII